MENIETQPKRNIPRDLFLHLLAIVTLYWSAISFVTLLWQHINYYFPDNLSYFYYSGFTSLIRFSVSSLIIIFPIFIAVSWFLNRIYLKESEVRESKIRKWLIYLTLFIAALVIIGDMVSVINALLGGEIKVRFILKALSILLTAGLIFGYYLDDVRKSIPTKSAKYFAWVTSALALIVVISSFFIVGTPNTARLIQFDEQKISDLSDIQGQIVNYWQKKEVLPNSLSDLNDQIMGYKVPVDSQSDAAYEYSVKNATTLTFELCATFNKKSLDNIKQPYSTSAYNQNWQHEAGRVCFERTIDKQLYPPYSKIK